VMIQFLSAREALSAQNRTPVYYYYRPNSDRP